MYYYLNILKKLSLRKILNFAALVLSYLSSRIVRKPIHFGKAFSLSIEPTTSCNLRCPQCPSGLRKFTRPTGMLDMGKLEEFLQSIAKHVFSINFYFQGEPYLNPNFLDMVRLASNQRIYTTTSTNAHYLNEKRAIETVKSGLDEIIISIDGATQDIYEKYRKGGDLEKVLNGAQTLIKTRNNMGSKKPFIIFQFIVFRFNEHQIEEVKKLTQEMGADRCRIKTAQIYDFENNIDLIPQKAEHSRYSKDKNGKWQIKNPLHSHCWRMWQGCVITWDGKIVPCCFDKDAQHVLGDLSVHSFNKIWKSDAYKNFRGAILAGRNKIDICTNCTEGTNVWA